MGDKLTQLGPKTRWYGYAADSVLALHLLISVYAVFGGLLTILEPSNALFHIPLVAWVVIVNLASWVCPLTPLEQKLRILACKKTYRESWTQHYIAPLVRPLGMPRRLELVAAFSTLFVNLLIYTSCYLYKTT